MNFSSDSRVASAPTLRRQFLRDCSVLGLGLCVNGLA
ncbi:MAG: hypothetical protein RLZZ612_2066, partial [Pseudomonadota bacterium]